MKYSILQEDGLSFEKAFELGKTLTHGGVALSDNQTAFRKKGGK
jgi:hypothetical protein